MRVSLEIAVASAILLFAAVGALVSLMYLLTNPLIFGEPARERRRAKRRARRLKKRRGLESELSRMEQANELDRRRRAAALAAAVARAEHETNAVPHVDGPADWRLLHREIRLHQRVGRKA
jgi:hypothetical protein